MPLHTVKIGGTSAFPALAFGTGSAAYQKPAEKIVQSALSTGVRFIDGAEVYKNEDSAGEGISNFLAQGKVKREDIVVLTKVGNDGVKDIQSAVKQSLAKLRVDYLDAYLIHFPPRGKDGLPSNVDAWKEMEKVKDAGLAKHIGVSNFYVSDLQEILDSKPKYKPEINQLELHPYIYGHPDYKATLDLGAKHNIVTMVYGALLPITRDALPADGPLTKVLDSLAAAKPGRTHSTILLRYAFQRGGNGIIASTTTKESRAKEYLDTLDSSNDANLALSEDELRQIDQAGEQRGWEKFYVPQYFTKL